MRVWNQLKRGIFKSVADLEAAITSYIREHNKTPKLFVWRKTAKAILTKLDRLPIPSERVSALVLLRHKFRWAAMFARRAAQQGQRGSSEVMGWMAP